MVIRKLLDRIHNRRWMRKYVYFELNGYGIDMRVL